MTYARKIVRIRGRSYRSTQMSHHDAPRQGGSPFYFMLGARGLKVVWPLSGRRRQRARKV